MLFRYLAHQESHYAYANSCIHPHAAVAETMSVSVPQPQLEQQRADEKQDDNKAKEMLAADSTATAATGASDLNKAGQDAERKPEAAVEAPARVFGPQVKGAETATRGKRSQKRGLSGRALDVDLVNSGMWIGKGKVVRFD